MGRLFVHVNTSVDGFINDASGSLGWWIVDDEFKAHIDGMLESIDGMIFGRVAHQELAGFWPTATASEASPTQVRLMHDLPKYVLTQGTTVAPWNNTHTLGPGAEKSIERLKRESNRDLALFAGAGAINSLLAAGLVDELRLVVHPSIVGGGTRMFEGADAPRALTLSGMKRFASGVVLLGYRTTQGWRACHPDSGPVPPPDTTRSSP